MIEAVLITITHLHLKVATLFMSVSYMSITFKSYSNNKGELLMKLVTKYTEYTKNINIATNCPTYSFLVQCVLKSWSWYEKRMPQF